MKLTKKKILSMLMTMIMLASLWTIPETKALANTSLPSISSSKYISTYTYASSGKVYAYTNAALTTKTGGYISCGSDENRIIAIKGNAVQASYPVSSGRKTAWFEREKFTYRDLAADGAKLKFTSSKKITTYKWKNKTNTFGYIAIGDICYLLRGDSASDWLQVIYPTGNTYKMAWVKGADIRSVIWPTTTGIKLNTTAITLTSIGSTSTLRATVTPSNSVQGVTWSTSNSSVATVSGGVVKAVGSGTATITATSGSKSATAKVTVSITPTVVHPTGVSLNKTSATLYVGKSLTLTATVSPGNATNKSVTWSTSNSKIATVSGGKVTPVGAGSATITAKTSNGKTASCKITVKNSPVSSDRTKICNYMRSMATIKWKPSKTFTHWSGGRQWIKGKYYYGIPYSQATRTTTLEKFKKNMNGSTYVGPAGQKTYLGSDCSSAVSMAWKKYDTSFNITSTVGFLPGATKIQKVGSYSYSSKKLTKANCTSNGTSVMYKAYKQLKPGDAVVERHKNSKGSVVGHVMLVVSVSNSSIKVIEQTTFDSSLSSTWRKDKEYSFKNLYNNGYLPVKLKGLE